MRTHDSHVSGLSTIKRCLVLMLLPLVTLTCLPSVSYAKVTNLSRAAKAADSIAKIGYSKKCFHDKNAYLKSTTVKKLQSTRRISCSVYASLVLQQAGCLPPGVICKHTSADHKKKTKSDCFSNSNKLTNCKILRVDCLYKNMDEKFKQKGMVYVYPSNMAVSAGNGRIWTFNHQVNQYTAKGQVYRNSGYCFSTKILYVICPNGTYSISRSQ